MNQWRVIVYDPTQLHFGSNILKIVAVSVFLDTANALSSLEIRENLKPETPSPPFATHILNRLDMRIHHLLLLNVIEPP